MAIEVRPAGAAEVVQNKLAVLIAHQSMSGRHGPIDKNNRVVRGSAEGDISVREYHRRRP
jgi:hypothetical protein